MKSLEKLADVFDKWANSVDKNVEKSLMETAEQIYQDILENAPTGTTGNYKASIKIEPVKMNKGQAEVFIGSDLMVGPTKWTGGSVFNLGYLLENGTFEHAIPNAWAKGFYYGYVDEKGVFHKGTLDKNWHPGSKAVPHYSIALEKNKELLKKNIEANIKWR